MLAETSAEAARRFGSSPAFVTDEGLTLSYAQFDAMADEAAVGLAELGVGEGDVVGLLLPSVPEHFIAYVAAAKLGAVTAAVNPKLVVAERDAVLRAANPLVVLTTEQLAPSARAGSFTTVLVEPATDPGAVLEGLRHPGTQPPPLAPEQDRPIAIVLRRAPRARRRARCSAVARSASSPSATSARTGVAGATPWRARRWRTSGRRRSSRGT